MNTTPKKQAKGILSQQPATNKAGGAAVTYAARGWSIIPVIDKRAAGLWKPFQTQPADEPTLRRMFARPGITGLAVILGSASGGLACRDFDDADAYHRWAADHRDLASTLPTVKTARGHHVYFAGPDGYANLGDGEYRADAGHYCRLPPSVHPDGPTYTWLIPLPDGELPSLDPVKAGLVTPSAATQQLSNPATQQLIACVHEFSIEIENSIRATLPTGPGQRNRQVFELARAIKAVTPTTDNDELRIIVETWHRLALPIIRTKDFAETWTDFRIAWINAKTPPGGTWASIMANAKAMPLPGGFDAEDGLLVNLCAELSHRRQPFPLSFRKAAEVLGITHQKAGRLLKMLVFEGVIELATPAGTKGSRRAAEYIFLGERT